MMARQWVQLLGLGLALAAVIVVTVAVVLPAAALGLALALLVAGAVLVAQRVTAVAQAARSAVMGTRPAEEPPQPILRLELADGAVLSARPVPLPGGGEHTLLLTREGYVVASAEGKVLHRI
jgi:hypothetical protein